jgi:hypothetical protein
MIRRPNVRAKCFQHNLRARSTRNRYYMPRDHKLYSRWRCRWCQRGHSTWDYWLWPNLCHGCCNWLNTNAGEEGRFYHPHFVMINGDVDEIPF